ncbi:unnamed protein product [Discosporangium mesarthrocarpum]
MALCNDRDTGAQGEGGGGSKRAAGEIPGFKQQEEAVEAAERGVRAALLAPNNKTFLRSALAGLRRGEVVVVLKVLRRMLEGRSPAETATATAVITTEQPRAQLRDAPVLSSVVTWAAAVIDAHFTQLAVGGLVDGELAGALHDLRETVGKEIEHCELLSEVGTLVDEAARAQALALKRRNSRETEELYSLRVLRF